MLSVTKRFRVVSRIGNVSVVYPVLAVNKEAAKERFHALNSPSIELVRHGDVWAQPLQVEGA